MSGNKPSNPPPQNNPYASAAGAYDQHAQKHTPDQRELEARVLLKAVKAFQEIQGRWDKVSREELDECLKYNRQVWMMFVDTAIEDEMTTDRSSCATTLPISVFLSSTTRWTYSATQSPKSWTY